MSIVEERSRKANGRKIIQDILISKIKSLKKDGKNNEDVAKELNLPLSSVLELLKKGE